MPHSHATCHTGAPQSTSQSLLSGHGIAPAYRSACAQRRRHVARHRWHKSERGFSRSHWQAALPVLPLSLSRSLSLSLPLPLLLLSCFSLLSLQLPYWCQTAVRHVRATRIWNGALSAVGVGFGDGVGVGDGVSARLASVSAAHSFVKYTPCVCAF